MSISHRVATAGLLAGLLAAGSAQALGTVSLSASADKTGVVDSGSTALLTDGDFATGALLSDPSVLSWHGQEGAGASGNVLTFDFGHTVRLVDLMMAAQGNDQYAVQVSSDKSNWTTLLKWLPSSLDSSGLSGGSLMTYRTTVAGDAGYSSIIDFAPVETRYVRIFAIVGGGDGNYGVSEVAFVGVVPEPETAALLLAGLGAVGLLARRRR